jgi:hypothetical protein
MNKIQYIYKLIGNELIIKKYKLTIEDMLGKPKISKKTLFKDIKKGLQNMGRNGTITVPEYKTILATIKSNIIAATGFSGAVKPFLMAAASSGSGDI